METAGDELVSARRNGVGREENVNSEDMCKGPEQRDDHFSLATTAPEAVSEKHPFLPPMG